MIVRLLAAAAGGILALVQICGAQTAGRYDGIYVLRSTTLVPGSAAMDAKRPCSLALHAAPLGIVDGHAATTFRRNASLTGDVAPAGDFTLMDSGAFLEFTGKIDIHGALRGYLNTFDGCGYELLFQKRRVK